MKIQKIVLAVIKIMPGNHHIYRLWYNQFVFHIQWYLNHRFIGDQLAIAKETGRRLGMGTNMYPSSSLLGGHKDASIAALPIEELIEKANGFAGVFPS